jgi:UDP-N-acetylmuramoyl-L-alanyl-D-glutamate--2,6-diaminopimelate ligase
MKTYFKKKLKKIIPSGLLSAYHWGQAILAALYYRFPSKKMIVVGITGTKGKTSSCEFVWSVLSAGGYKTGLLGTAHILIGTTEIENAFHMTMPSPWIIQKYLAQMRDAGCTHVVLEVSSEGLKQHRHIGIACDIAVFTNLSPEHLSSHGNSFEEYRNTKALLFKHALKINKKNTSCHYTKTNIINKDSSFGEFYYNINQKMSRYYSLEEYKKNQQVDSKNNTIILESTLCHVYIPGEFNLYNALAAYMVGKACGLTINEIRTGIENVVCIPGRMEKIDLGQSFDVYIDYAHEKLSMENLLKTAQNIRNTNGKIIVLFGAEGGGRDKTKRKEMAILADKYADYAILSNVDPYEDDPMEIINDIAQYFSVKKKEGNLFLIPDRALAIHKAFSLAQKNDVVLICGKGSEKTIQIDGKILPWDERSMVKNLLTNYMNHV